MLNKGILTSMITFEQYSNFVSESFLDYPDNKSLAIVLYMPGCDRNCLGCHNTNLKEYQNFEDNQQLIEFLKHKCKLAYTNKLCLQGGDPLYKDNLFLTKQILSEMSSKYDICIYTGGTIKEVEKLNLQGFKYIKCGIFDTKLYIGSKKTDNYIQFATKNQQLYDSNLKLLSKEGIYYF